MENLIENTPYHLAQNLTRHSAGVRSLAVRKNHLITGSIDKTCKVYLKKDGKYSQSNEITIFDDYIISLYINEACTQYIVGCKNNIIYILDLDGNPVNMLEGHSGPVNSLSGHHSKLISGSWDGSAIVWDLETSTKTYTLEGHAYAVCVLALENDTYITGSQDKNLNIWEGKKKVKTITNAHSDIIRELVRYGEIGFASCSNDEVIKVWSLSGELITTMMGHTAFIFSISETSTGKLISGGEDRSLRIWNHDENSQTIFHPSTLWVVRCDQDGDIITACGDGMTRVFSIKGDYKAPEDEIESFDKEAEMAGAQSHDGLSEAELAKLPSIDALKRIRGKKDGEIKIFKNGVTPEAYVWKEDVGGWDKIGDVIGNKTTNFYEGDRYFPAGEYEHIFEVDDESGVANKKIPFNMEDNPLETAEKFIAREGLSKGFVEQITTFIRQNTRGKAGGGSGSGSQQAAPKQVKKEKKTSKYFPYMNSQTYEGANFDAMAKKLLEFNEALKETIHYLKEAEVNRLNKVIEKLKDTENYYSTTFTELETEVITHKLLKWPAENLMPVLDLFRVFLIHHNSEKLFSGLDGGLSFLSFICQVLRSAKNETMVILCVKILCNFTKHINTKNALMKYQDMIIEALEGIGVYKSNKDTLRTVLAAFSFNLSIGANDASDTAIEKLLKFNIESLKYETNAENIFKYLVSCGNALALSSFSAEIAKSVGLKQAIDDIKIDSNSTGAVECKNDLLNWL